MIIAELTYQSVSHVAQAAAPDAAAIAREPRMVIVFIAGLGLRVHQCATSAARSAWLMMVCPVRCAGNHLSHPHLCRDLHRRHQCQHLALWSLVLVANLTFALNSVPQIPPRISTRVSISAKSVVTRQQLCEPVFLIIVYQTLVIFMGLSGALFCQKVD